MALYITNTVRPPKFWAEMHGKPKTSNIRLVVVVGAAVLLTLQLLLVKSTWDSVPAPPKWSSRELSASSTTVHLRWCLAAHSSYVCVGIEAITDTTVDIVLFRLNDVLPGIAPVTGVTDINDAGFAACLLSIINAASWITRLTVIATSVTDTQLIIAKLNLPHGVAVRVAFVAFRLSNVTFY